MHSIRADVVPVDPSLVPLIISEIKPQEYIQFVLVTLLVYDTNILLMRVMALYHQNKKLAACLRTLFFIDAAAGLGLLIYTNIDEEITVGELAVGVTVCGEDAVTPKITGSVTWAIPMAYTTILMALALYKAAQFWKESAGFSQFDIVKVVMQDQAIYFSIITAEQVGGTNVILGNTLSIMGSPSFLCVLGSRLLVHLKEAGERGVNEGTSYRMRTVSTMGFA
ncbi:hypothetical protein DFH11DRAFT_1691975 [Phellopilus nigrolimitatus]|nr:hypothetical protein DFH11DRAFT_1691975 [Phellopilus nigrolimitatus]